ncbi:MAG: bacterial Ig-like domain-containing protein [Clostridia bacterium]|nr:bacterial Ig-like domain-containing protein [Clostridia bacterium]
MNFRKLRFTFLIIAALVLSLFSLVACGGGETEVTDIFIASSNTPRTVYVEGQELDLSGGILSVVKGGATNPMPLDHADVSVSGYDSTRLGQQTLTVSYGGLSTELKVTVIPRMVAESFDTSYFIGDAFNYDKGRLKIAKDNGTTFTVPLNSEKVTVDFDFAAAGSSTVGVEYRDGGTVYTASFEVTVHTPASIDFTAPKKTSYQSHETALNLSGGFLTVKAAAPSTFSKYIPITEAMVSGYAPWEVTMSDRGTPVKQTLTVSYGKSYETTYDVFVSYSAADFVNDLAEDLSALDFTAAIPEIDASLAALAAEALEGYLELTSAERELIEEDTALALARCAVVYLNEEYIKEAAKLADAISFKINENRELVISYTAKSYAAVADALSVLEDTRSTFNRCAKALTEAEEEFANEILYDTVSFVKYIIAHNSELVSQLTPTLSFMLTAYDLLADVKPDWTVDTLGEYAVAIEAATDRILTSSFKGHSYAELYGMVAAWRDDGEYLNIIYNYYYFVKPGGREEIKSHIWQGIPFPDMLGEWYTAYSTAISMRDMFTGEYSMLANTSFFMYYYNEVLELRDRLKGGDNELLVGLYELIDFDTGIDVNLRRAQNGYFYIMGEALGSPKIEAAWEIYLRLTDIYLGFSDETDLDGIFTEMLDAISALSPAELYSFISTLNFNYDASGGLYGVFFPSVDKPTSTLSLMLGVYYDSIFGAEALPVIANLMLAMERCALLGINDNAVTDFGIQMAQLYTGLEELDAEKRAELEDYFADLLDKYGAIYSYTQGGAISPDKEGEALISELYSALDEFDAIIAYISSPDYTDAEKNRVMPLLFALNERAAMLHGEISALGGDAATALYSRIYTLGDASFTLDKRFIGAESISVNFMLSITLTGEDGEVYRLYDLYSQSSLSGFLGKIAPLLLAEHKGERFNGDIADIMADFRALSSADKNTFYTLMANLLYYDAITSCFDGSNAVAKIIEAEIAYALYEIEGTAESLDNFCEKILEAKEIFDTLGESGALGEAYEYYLEKYNSLA